MISQTLVVDEKYIANCIRVETRNNKITLTMHLPNADDDGIRRTVFMDTDTATRVAELLNMCVKEVESYHG